MLDWLSQRQNRRKIKHYEPEKFAPVEAGCKFFSLMSGWITVTAFEKSISCTCQGSELLFVCNSHC